MNFKYSKHLLVGFVVVASGLFLAGCGEQPSTDTNTNVVDTTGTKPPTTTTTTPPVTDTTTTPPVTTTTPPVTTTTDFSLFLTTKQTVNEDSTEKYTLDRITDATDNGFYLIGFRLPVSTDNVVKPKATAEYRADLGAIRVMLYNVTTDNSGIAFLKSREINKVGVQKIYHQVSGTEGVAIYDIGVTSSTPFLFEWTTDSNSEFLTLKIKNIATTTTTAPILDLGATAYSKTKQTIVGATTAESAASSGFSYNASSNVASVVFNVSGSTDKPIPSCSAEYVGGALELTFSDMKDVFGGNRTLDGGAAGSITLTRTGNVSVYRFTAVSDKEFKLSALTNPNQVVLDIKLK